MNLLEKITVIATCDALQLEAARRRASHTGL